MNGIIHACSHPNDNDIHFRITENEIFIAIFNYIDTLFSKIKPKKLFFMAIDGVAPRAKMNQQRARRFRTAKDALEAKKQAKEKGVELPDEPAFDSNCITPGMFFNGYSVVLYLNNLKKNHKNQKEKSKIHTFLHIKMIIL